ncbi:MarR family winged helix-turn-helix transcriptional regulator [Photobacterium alginatilyticum]|uniref:MarR family transcriptional regulator n=1 Tax=Photobacterium alginatilyticum TaxID=1775171 RepID=A0ABW9YMP2_9GAMM|nr:MarR family transcriptional regulator [Photobacterium alginatilyticum]NBI55073.1 MarR family transcriptional regulator [Photobacterium alginatilyticum]
MNSHSEHVLALLERLSRVINNDAGLSELKPAQWEALRFLSQANKFSRTPSALTSYLGVTKGTVSQTLNALERKGLICKKKDAGDRRSVSIQLTEKGKGILNNDPLKALLGAIEQLSNSQLNTLASTLELVLTTALQQRAGAPFGVCKSCKYFMRNVVDGTPHRCALLQVPLTSMESDLICREHTN